MKDDQLYLIHIIERIERIEQYTSEGRDTFLADTKTQDAVLRNLHTLSESTQRISDNLKTKHPEVGWRSIAAFRNVVVRQLPPLESGSLLKEYVRLSSSG